MMVSVALLFVLLGVVVGDDNTLVTDPNTKSRGVFEAVPNFLSDEAVEVFLQLLPRQEDCCDDDNGNNSGKRRVLAKPEISASLHKKIREMLVLGGNKMEEEDGGVIGATQVPLTAIYGSTHPHSDHYQAEEAKGAPLLGGTKTGFIFLNDNADASFHILHNKNHYHDNRCSGVSSSDGLCAALPSTKISVERGKLVVFEGDIPHFTQLVNKDHFGCVEDNTMNNHRHIHGNSGFGMVQMLGPFAILGNELSPVGTGCGALGEPCCTGGLCDDPNQLSCRLTCLECGGNIQACCDQTAATVPLCEAGFECNNGSCTPCGGVGQSCCFQGPDCGGDLVCDAQNVCVVVPGVPCGSEGLPCCDGGTCDADLVCDAQDVCIVVPGVPCGSEGFPCCEDETNPSCSPGLKCKGKKSKGDQICQLGKGSRW